LRLIIAKIAFIAGLEQEQVVDFICQLLQVCEVPKNLCELIQVKSQGVPSWCQQLIKDALYANTIQIVSKASVQTPAEAKQVIQKLDESVPPPEKHNGVEQPATTNNNLPASVPGSRRGSMVPSLSVAASKPLKHDILKKYGIVI